MMVVRLFAMGVLSWLGILLAGAEEAVPPDGFLEVDLWDGVPPATAEGVAGAEVIKNGRVEQVVRPRIWFSRPEGKVVEKGAPCVLIVPGGGYGIVCTGHEGVEVAKYLNQRGVATAVLLYRCRPQRFPAPILDARRAHEILLERSDEWGIDSSQIGVMGFSAGGHLAGLMCSGVEIKPRYQRPAFGVLVYPVVRLKGDHSHGGSGRNLLGNERYESEADALGLDALVDEAWPPSYAVHEKGDPVVPVKGVEILAETVRAKGIPFELRVEEGKVHGFGWKHPKGIGDKRPTSDWLPMTTDWILETLHEK